MIASSLEQLWSDLAPAGSLLPDLGFDAVLARADHGEFMSCLPRLLEVATLPGADPETAIAVFDRLEANEWTSWPDRQRRPIEKLLDLWWATELALEPGIPPVHDVLAALARLDQPMQRWLQPWLEDFDGPGARHFVALVIDQLSSQRWAELPDRREQVLAWTRSEPAVLGLTVIGGVHLEAGELGEALDRML